MVLVGWIAVLLSVLVTGDFVFDLAFEAESLAADTSESADEPDNAAEHTLIPSPAASHIGSSGTVSDVAIDFAAAGAPTRAANRAHLQFHPPRQYLASFAVPLRI